MKHVDILCVQSEMTFHVSHYEYMHPPVERRSEPVAVAITGMKKFSGHLTIGIWLPYWELQSGVCCTGLVCHDAKRVFTAVSGS